MARTFGALAYLLNSLGVTLLALSVVLVPTSALFADTGGTPKFRTDCKANNGCANGCKINAETCDPSSGTAGCTNGCSSCTCVGCIYQQMGFFCNCQCQSSTGTCSDTVTCNPN